MHIRLFDHDDIGEPGRIHDLSNKIGFEEFFYFFSDCLASFFSHIHLLLRYWFGLGTNGELVAYNAGWIPSMSDGCHENRFVFLCRSSVMCLSSWLVRSLLSCIHCSGLGPSYNLKSSSIGFGPLSALSLHESTSNTSSRLAR